MSDTQTEKRTRAGQNRSGSAAAVEGGGRDELDQAELSRHLAEIAEKSQRLVADFLARQGSEGVAAKSAWPIRWRSAPHFSR